MLVMQIINVLIITTINNMFRPIKTYKIHTYNKIKVTGCGILHQRPKQMTATSISIYILTGLASPIQYCALDKALACHNLIQLKKETNCLLHL